MGPTGNLPFPTALYKVLVHSPPNLNRILEICCLLGSKYYLPEQEVATAILSKRLCLLRQDRQGKKKMSPWRV